MDSRTRAPRAFRGHRRRGQLELGGVFGVAILATVFTRPAVYTSAPAFTAGFSAALWAGAALTATEILLALAGRRRPAAAPAQPAPSHASTPEPALSAR